MIGIFKWALPRSTRMFKWRTAGPSAMSARSSKLMKLKFAESFLSTEIGEMSILRRGFFSLSSQLTNHVDFTLLWAETRRITGYWKEKRGVSMLCTDGGKSPPVNRGWASWSKGKCEAETSCRGNRFSPSGWHYPTEFVT